MPNNFEAYVPGMKEFVPTRYLDSYFDQEGFFILNEALEKVRPGHKDYEELDRLRMEPIRKRTEEFCRTLQEANMRAGSGTSTTRFGSAQHGPH